MVQMWGVHQTKDEKRLGTRTDFWNDRIKKMLGSSGLRGYFFGCQEASIEQVAAHRHQRTANLSPQLSSG
jgi:hypothetical protein